MNRTIDAGQPDGTDSLANPLAASTTELVRRAFTQLRRLIRDELRLTRAQLAARARHLGAAAGLFAGAGVAAGYAAAVLLLTLVALLALAVPTWAAMLIVAVVLFGVAALMAAVGRGRLRRTGSIVPQATIASVKADLDSISRAARQGRMRQR